MDTDSMYMEISGTSIDEIVKSELREKYDNGGKAEFLSTSNYHDRTPGLFKAEFQGTRMITLIGKCYYAEDVKSKPKFSCKSIAKCKTLCLGRDISKLSTEASTKHKIRDFKYSEKE